jgi:hypothetical protein
MSISNLPLGMVFIPTGLGFRIAPVISPGEKSALLTDNDLSVKLTTRRGKQSQQ